MKNELLEQMEPVALEMRCKILDTVNKNVSSKIKLSFDKVETFALKQIEALEESNSWRVVDMQSAMFLKMSCTMLGIYQSLLPEFENKQDLLEIMRLVLSTVFYGEGMDAYLEKRLGISKDKPETAWKQVCKNFKGIGEIQFGKTWFYEQSIMDDKRCFVNVRKCGFCDFFLENGARDLLYCLCVLDYVWTDALEQYGIYFERPTILAEDSDACRFQFFKK